MKKKCLHKVAVIAAVGIGAIVQANASVIVTHVNSPATGAIDLTSMGTTDWVKLGNGTDSSVRYEKTGASHIGAIGGSAVTGSWSAFPWSMSWSDGEAPNGAESNVLGSWESKQSGSAAFSFDVTGLEGRYLLQVYGSGYMAGYQLTASLSDGGASDSVADSVTGGTPILYTVDFTATAGQTLSVLFEQTADLGGGTNDNIGMGGITLASIPEPATLGLVGAVGSAILFIRRCFVM